MIRELVRTLERAVTETRGFQTIQQLDDWMDYQAGFGTAAGVWSGASVNSKTAMQQDVFWAAVNVRAGSLAQLPLVTYRVRETIGQDKAYDHYLYNVLRRRFNPYMTAFSGKRLMETWICIHGNAYAWMDINGRGQTTAIWPWHPSRVKVEWKQWEGSTIPFYSFRHDDGEKTWQPYFNMIHLRGPSTDGFFGLNVVETHRQTIGYGLAIQEHGSRVFSNGASVRGVFTPKAGAVLTKPQMDEARETWQKMQGGLSNAGKAAFIPAALDFQATTLSLKDAEYIAASQMNAPQICRVVGVPPHKVFDLSRSTNNNITHQDLEWLRDYLGPQLTNWEDELNGALLSEREAQSILVEFLINYQMRTDIATRAMYLKAALGGAPWMTQNEGRDKEGFNPMETDEADEFPVTNNAPGAESNTQQEQQQ